MLYRDYKEVHFLGTWPLKYCARKCDKYFGQLDAKAAQIMSENVQNQESEE